MCSHPWLCPSHWPPQVLLQVISPPHLTGAWLTCLPALTYLGRYVPGGPRLSPLELPDQELTASSKHIPDLANRAAPLQGPTAILGVQGEHIEGAGALHRPVSYLLQLFL